MRGTLAHLGERATEDRKVGGSSPPSPKFMFLNIWLFLFCTSQAEYPVPGEHMVQVGNKMDEISNLRIIIKDEIFFLVNLKYAIYHVCGYGKLFFKGKGANVVLNDAGEVVTAFAKASTYWRF